METFRRYFYVSKSRIAASELSASLENIAVASSKANAMHSITGVLIYSNGYFGHLIEGQAGTIAGLVSNLQHDGRHEQMTVLVDEQRDVRRTTRWAIGYNGAPIYLGRKLEDMHAGIASQTDINKMLDLMLTFSERHYETIKTG